MKKIEKEIYGTEKGSALALVLVMVAAVSIILTSLLGYITSQVSYSKDRVERERAFQVAEAGIFFYRWYLAHEISGRTAEQINDFWETTGPNCPIGVCSAYEADFKDFQGNVIGRYRLEVQKPQLGSTIVMATSTGWTFKKPSVKRTVRVRFRRPSWSENIVLANDDMRFGSGTTVNGRIHSNRGVRFDGLATNVVSSSLPKYDDLDHDEIGAEKLEFGVHTHKMNNGTIVETYRPNEVPPNPVDSRTDVFQGGRQFPVANISFDSVVSDISYMRSQAETTETRFDNSGQGRRIILKTDGTFDMCTVNSFSENTAIYNASSNKTDAIVNYIGEVYGASGSYASTNGTACITSSCCIGALCPWISSSNHNRGKCYSMSNHTIPNNGVIFVANHIWLEGTINNRKVSIVAAELSDESENTGGKKNVFLGMDNLLYTNTDGSDIIGVIAQNNVKVIRDSLTNLTIDAALLAKDGRVGRDYYNGTIKNSITINGSIATNLRYGFSYTNGTGYIIRNLNFDNNLLYYPPPYFPTGTEYAIDQWEEL